MGKQTEEQKLMRKWWVRAVLALIFAALAYGFASLAIDSGSLIVYAIAIFFLVWAFIQAKRSAVYLFLRSK
jgi:hypothetical protein